MKVDYMMQEYHGGRNDGFLTEKPVGIKLPADAIVQMRYDLEAMRWIPSRPSKIKYPKGRDITSRQAP